MRTFDEIALLSSCGLRQMFNVVHLCWSSVLQVYILELMQKIILVIILMTYFSASNNKLNICAVAILFKYISTSGVLRMQY